MTRFSRILTGIAFLIAALLGTVCTAMIVAVTVLIVRGDEGPMGKDVIAIPAVALLAFLLLKAARDLWQKLWTMA